MPHNRIANLIGSRCVAVICALSLLGCAAKEKKTITDLYKDQMEWMQTQMKEQEGLLKELRAELSTLKGENRQLKTKVKEAAQAPKMPVVKIRPGDELDLDEAESRGEVEAIEEDAEPISSSTHAVMHNYFEATRAYSTKDYDRAVVALRKFLEVAPEHVYADRAQYWLVQSHFSNQEYSQALIEANKMVAKYPHSFRLAQVMVLKANALIALGQRAEGRSMLREFLKRFPNHDLSDSVSHKLAEVSPYKGAPPLMDKEVRLK